MTANRYRGATVRITRGRGAGQERAIASNTATTLTVAPPWDAPPDSEQLFRGGGGRLEIRRAVEDAARWSSRFRTGRARRCRSCGRAANVNDVECAAELSTVTRWQIGGSGAEAAMRMCRRRRTSAGAGRRGGTVELSGVSFTDLTNTRTISSATLTLYYRDELADAAGTLAVAASERRHGRRVDAAR